MGSDTDDKWSVKYRENMPGLFLPVFFRLHWLRYGLRAVFSRFRAPSSMIPTSYKNFRKNKIVYIFARKFLFFTKISVSGLPTTF